MRHSSHVAQLTFFCVVMLLLEHQVRQVRVRSVEVDTAAWGDGHPLFPTPALGRSLPADPAGQCCRRDWQVSLEMAITFDAGNGQVAGKSGQFGCWPWSVPLAKLVNCCGEGGQLAGVLHTAKGGVTPRSPRTKLRHIGSSTPSPGHLLISAAEITPCKLCASTGGIGP